MGLFGQKRQGGNGEIGREGGEPAAESAPDWAAFFGSSERYERFERAVRHHFRARGESVLIQDGAVTGPSLGETRLGLTNVGQLCAQSDESEWPALIARHFDMLMQAHSEMGGVDAEALDFEWARTRLAIRLYTAEDITAIRDVAVVREDVPGLVSLLCLDLPSAVQSIKREQISHWEQSDDELFEIARGNLAVLINVEPELAILQETASLWILEGDSVYNSSALLRLEDYPQVRGRHGTFVSAPTRHVVLALPFDSAEAMNSIGHLIQLTAHAEREGPGSLSTRVWLRRDDTWMEIPWEVTGERLAVHAPEEFVRILQEMEPGGSGPPAE